MRIGRTTRAAGRRVRLGPDFTKLWLAQGASNIGDGAYVTALPLLAASLTRDPVPVSAVVIAEWLPWLLFGLLAGALLDRWDRRRVMWTVDAGRVVVVGAFAVAVLLDWASIPLLMLTGFLLGTGQTLVDTASQALVPSLVSRDQHRLERANGRLQGTQVVADQLAGPPLGGTLFAAAAWVPFLVDSASFAISSALVAAIPGRRARPAAPASESADSPPPTEGAGAAPPPDRGEWPAAPGGTARAEVRVRVRRPSLVAEIHEGLRWLFAHQVLRAMAALVACVNILWMSHTAIMVLFAQDRLGLGSVGFGLLLAAGAVGGVVGSVVAPWCSRRVGPVAVNTGGFILAGLAFLVQGSTREPIVAGACMAIAGLVVIVFNVIFGSLRQQFIPDHLLGRVISAFRLFSYGSVPLGALLGGLLARAFGLSAPFFVAGVALPVLALLSLLFVNPRSIEQARAAIS